MSASKFILLGTKNSVSTTFSDIFYLELLAPGFEYALIFMVFMILNMHVNINV